MRMAGSLVSALSKKTVVCAAVARREHGSRASLPRPSHSGLTLLVLSLRTRNNLLLLSRPHGRPLECLHVISRRVQCLSSLLTSNSQRPQSVSSSGAVQLSCLEILSDSDFDGNEANCNVRTAGDSVQLERMGTYPTSSLELACDIYARLEQVLRGYDPGTTSGIAHLDMTFSTVEDSSVRYWQLI
jgi:hypothetical protein